MTAIAAPALNAILSHATRQVSRPVTSSDDARLASLIAAAQSGDARAYQAALRAAVPYIAAIARRRGVAADRTDDVVQDTLLTIHRALPTYDPARPFLPWLGAIAERRAIDALRISGRSAARELHDPLATETAPDTSLAADLDLIRKQDASILRQAIAALPPGQREAAELLGLAEKTLDEAAIITGRNKIALKVNLHRALRALRQRLEGQDG